MNDPTNSPSGDDHQDPNADSEDTASTPGDTEQMVDALVSTQLNEARHGADLERLNELESKVAQALQASRAESTLKAYRTDWADFTLWCESAGLDSLPATAATVAAYLAELANPSDNRKPLAVSTIERRRASISEAHKMGGEANPALDPLVRQVMKGVRRQRGVAPKNRKTGLSTADIKAMVGGLDPVRSIDVRDKALLLIGFATALRRSELVALEVEDVEDHSEGLLVHLRRSKTDQEAAGRKIEVAYGEHLDTCPVRAYRAWLDESAIDSGPVFRGVDRHGRLSPTPLAGNSIARIIKRHAHRIGKNPDDFAGHSTRRGFSTEASRNGAPERTIATTTGHTTTKGLRPYIADAETFTDPPSRYLGL